MGDVVVGGLSKGQTPTEAFALSEGTHTIEIHNKELGKDLKRQVVVTPSNVTKLVVNLEE